MWLKTTILFGGKRLAVGNTPEDVGHAEDAERLVAAGPGPGGPDAGDDSAVSLHPDVTSVLHQHPVLTADRLALKAHCRDTHRCQAALSSHHFKQINAFHSLVWLLRSRTVQMVFGQALCVQCVTEFVDGAAMKLHRSVS